LGSLLELGREGVALPALLCDSPALGRAIGSLEQPIVAALCKHDKVFLPIPEERIDGAAANFLPFIDLGMLGRILNHPAHPTDALAAAQIGQAVVLDRPFLYEMPERRPAAMRLGDASAIHRPAAKLKPGLRDLVQENGYPISVIETPCRQTV